MLRHSVQAVSRRFREAADPSRHPAPDRGQTPEDAPLAKARDPLQASRDSARDPRHLVRRRGRGADRSPRERRRSPRHQGGRRGQPSQKALRPDRLHERDRSLRHAREDRRRRDEAQHGQRDRGHLLEHRADLREEPRLPARGRRHRPARPDGELQGVGAHPDLVLSGAAVPGRAHLLENLPDLGVGELLESMAGHLRRRPQLVHHLLPAQARRPDPGQRLKAVERLAQLLRLVGGARGGVHVARCGVELLRVHPLERDARLLQHAGEVGRTELHRPGRSLQQASRELEMRLALGVRHPALGPTPVASRVHRLFGPQDLRGASRHVEAAPQPAQVLFRQADSRLRAGSSRGFGARVQRRSLGQDGGLTFDETQLSLRDHGGRGDRLRLADRRAHVGATGHPHHVGELPLRFLRPGTDRSQLALRLGEARDQAGHGPARHDLPDEATFRGLDVRLDRSQRISRLAQAVANPRVLAGPGVQEEPRLLQARPHRREARRHGLETWAGDQKGVRGGGESGPRLREK